MNRLIALDFDTFVPSHFGFSTRNDLIEWRDMVEDGRRLARQAIQNAGSFGVQDSQMGRYFDAVYYPMREKYGKWHGFNEMFVLYRARPQRRSVGALSPNFPFFIARSRL